MNEIYRDEPALASTKASRPLLSRKGAWYTQRQHLGAEPRERGNTSCATQPIRNIFWMPNELIKWSESSKGGSDGTRSGWRARSQHRHGQYEPSPRGRDHDFVVPRDG